MRKKLIKKALEGTKAPGGTSTSTGGSGSDFAADKSSGYPNTGNTGASQLLGLYYGSTQRSQSTGGNSLTNGTGGKQGSGFTGGGGSSGGSPGFWEAGGGWSMIGLGAEVLGSLIPKQPLAALTLGLNAGYDAVSNAIAAVPGFGTIASGAMKIGGLLADGLTALGVGTDGVTTMDLILDSKFMKLTPVGLMNAFGASRLAELRKDLAVRDTLDNTNGGYSGFMDKWEDALKYSGKKVGLFSSKSSLNNKIFLANERMSRLQGVIGKKMEDDLLTALMEDRWNQRIMNDLNGGFGNIAFGRLGLKIETLAKVHEILNKPKVVDTLKEYEEVPEFKTGGKMNVIPEGSLHARLHHMENAEGLTKKGIPVVSISEGGDLEQQAEIELNEIIFNLEVTQELEKLMKDGTDNAAIEAGKLLVEEIFNNTDDRTGLLKLLEPEKKLQTPEEVVKNHQVFLEGGNLPTLKTIEELVEYALKLNPAFVLRIGPDMGYAEFTDKEGKKARGTHYLETGTDDRGRYLVYPRIQMKDGRLQDLGDKAWEEAKRNKNFLVFDNAKDAEKFTTEYKKSKLWKPFFDIWEQRYGSYKNGGVIERLNNLSPEQLDKLTEFLNSIEA